MLAASTASLPAATVMTAPCASATSIASCRPCEQGEVPPRLMLITRAGDVLVGAPATGSPTAHSRPAVTSSNVPPHLPSTRTGTILAFQSMPAIPAPLLVLAAMIPLTKVPCQLLGLAGKSCRRILRRRVASPGSEGSLSRPPPSLARCVSLTKSKPALTRPVNSGCVRDAGIEHGDRNVGASRLQPPRGQRVHAAHRIGKRPLLRVERVVGGRLGVNAAHRVGVLDDAIGLQRAGHRRELRIGDVAGQRQHPLSADLMVHRQWPAGERATSAAAGSTSREQDRRRAGP